MRVMKVLLALGLLELGLPPLRAEATTLVLVRTEVLAHAADRVVHGRVIATESRWERGRIMTRVRLRPEAGGADLWFERPGGTVGGVTMQVLGMPEFGPGERAVVLLAERGGRLRLVGMSEGKLAVVQRDGREVAFMRLRDNGPLEAVELATVMRRLSAAVLEPGAAARDGGSRAHP